MCTRTTTAVNHTPRINECQSQLGFACHDSAAYDRRAKETYAELEIFAINVGLCARVVKYEERLVAQYLVIVDVS